MEFNQSAWSSECLKFDSQGSEIFDNEHGYLYKQKEKSEENLRDFPDGPKVRRPPASAGSSPGQGRSHIPWSIRAHAPQQEKPPQQEAGTVQLGEAPACHKKRKPARSNENPVQP